MVYAGLSGSVMGLASLPLVLATVPRQHCFQRGLEGVAISYDDIPEDGIVDTEVLVSNSVTDTLDLRPGLRWKISEPIVWNFSYSLRDRLNRIGSRTADNRVGSKR